MEFVLVLGKVATWNQVVSISEYLTVFVNTRVSQRALLQPILLSIKWRPFGNGITKSNLIKW